MGAVSPGPLPPLPRLDIARSGCTAARCTSGVSQLKKLAVTEVLLERRNTTPEARLDRGELDDVLGFLIRRVSVYLDRQFSEHMSQTGASMPLYAILLVVEKNPGCRITDLCKSIGISQTNIVPVLDVLLENGLVVRTLSTVDRRARCLELSAAGKEYLDHLRSLHKRIGEEIELKLGAEDTKRLLELLRRLLG